MHTVLLHYFVRYFGIEFINNFVVYLLIVVVAGKKEEVKWSKKFHIKIEKAEYMLHFVCCMLIQE